MHSRGAVYCPSKTTKTLALLLKFCLFLRKPTAPPSVVVHMYEIGQQSSRFEFLEAYISVTAGRRNSILTPKES